MKRAYVTVIIQSFATEYCNCYMVNMQTPLKDPSQPPGLTVKSFYCEVTLLSTAPLLFPGIITGVYLKVVTPLQM